MPPKRRLPLCLEFPFFCSSALLKFKRHILRKLLADLVPCSPPEAPAEPLTEPPAGWWRGQEIGRPDPRIPTVTQPGSHERTKVPVTLWGFVVLVIFLATETELKFIIVTARQFFVHKGMAEPLLSALCRAIHPSWTEYCGPTRIHLFQP